MNAQSTRGVAWWLSPLRPLLIGMAALAVATLVASKTLPVHTVVIWAAAGKRGLAASRSDFEVGVIIIGLVVFGVWVIAGLFLTVMPLRHVLVPHAVYWKAAGHGSEMRHRYATYLSRAIGFTYWFIAVEVVVAVVSQKNGSLEVPWLPVVVSLLFIVILLVFAVWVFADGFRPPPRPAPRKVAGSAGR
ncbi:hypothetical protein GCM10025867_21380 [Frondihabitans sucicola]|uniref:DUF1648 domain-containing protein n=1 Tax=Frondihabitans sucicola TaxID=1268041 RepID=A0ABN6XY05_9MICO|nr:hypothetical protein [Frondihabitans sucicola]BDZ49897.1 hypothetical protein GCM10025867_21380 [Frondihabitans sucicola]